MVWTLCLLSLWIKFYSDLRYFVCFCTNHLQCNILSQLWECEKPREEGGQPGLVLGSLRGHLGPGDRGDRELGCCK